MTTKSGFYKHGKSHEDGGIPVLVDSSSPIEVELHEYKICSNAMESTKIFEFKDKTNKEILDEIFQYSDCEFKQNEANSGDFIICKLAVLDKKKRNITGTAKEIINVMQSEKSCNVTNDSKEYKDGGSLNQRNLIYIGDVGSSNVDESKKINLGKNEYDNKNRYEISDKDLNIIADLDFILEKVLKEEKIVTIALNEFIAHPVLFEAYPEFKKIPVNFVYTKKNFKATIRPDYENNKIYFLFNIQQLENEKKGNRNVLSDGNRQSIRGNERYRLYLPQVAHELEHIIQIREVFGGGSNVVSEQNRILRENGINPATATENERASIMVKAFDDYVNKLGEIESKDVEKRLNLSLEERKQIKPFALLNIDKSKISVLFPKKLDWDKLKDGGKINNEYIVFFKNKLNNDIIYSNVKAESLQSAIDRTKSLYNWTEILWIKGFELKESNEGVQFFYEAIKNYWSSNKFINIDLVDGQIIFTGYGNSVAFDFIAKFLKKENDVKVFDGGYLFNDDLDIEINPDFTFDDSKIIEYLTQYKNGGSITEQGTLYTKDKKTKLEYIKNGSDYEFIVYEAEENPVSENKGDGKSMNYNQFVNYLYSETYIDDKKTFVRGGEIENKDETYTKWKNLVNMSKSELEKFYNSEEGKNAGLSASEAKSQGIDSGRESARWIMKMKDTPKSEWTSDMWRWAKKQISFISRMSGMKGDLYDDKGNKTRKHTSLLIWGHNPEKYNDGGEINKNDKIINDIKLSSRAIIDVNGEKLVKEIYGNKDHLIELLYSLDSKNLFQIYYIFVSKDIRRLGIGSKLMDLAKNKAIELGFDNILCLVADYKGEDYDNLVSFYKKNGFEFVENSDKKMTLKLDTEFNNGSLKLMKWYIDWYKGISDKMNITLSLPNLLSPFKENNVVIMDLFEKIDQTIDAKKYLQEIINKADEYKVTLYLEPIPRYKYFLDDAEKIRRISKEYLISYYEKFGFELTPNRQFMKRNFKEKLKNGGELTTNESCEKFIKEHENIFKNGYYSFVKNIGIFADSYGGKMPKIDSLIIISYNSGGQNNLKVTDTINPIVLQKQIGELIEEESGIPKIIILKHLTSSKRVNEDIFDIIKNNNVIIIDRDEVVCYNLINKLKNGGELKTNEMENKSIGDLKFTSYEDGMKWIENESKKYPSKNHFYASNEYKLAYPIINNLAKEEKKLFGEKGIKIMNSLGINFGDSVYYDYVSPFGFSEEYTGIVINKNGVPYVKLDKGQETMSGKKSVIWNKGWVKNKTNEMENKETLQGGKADKLTIEDIAKKHNVSIEYAKEQLNKGMNIESEHTNDTEKQKEIALDHLSEFIEYYKELEKMEEKLKTGSEEINLEYENLVKNLDSKLKTDNHLVINSAVNELLKLVSDNPYLYTKYLTKIHSIPKRYRVGTSPYIKDNELPKVIEWLKENNINLFELLDVKEYQLPKYKPFSIKSDDKTFMAIHSEFASTDDLRPQMLGSNFNEHGVVTTDAHRLLFTEYRGESSEKFGNYCYTKKCFSQEDNVQSSKYPNWSVIIPRESSHKEVLNSKYLYDFIKNSINLQLNNNYNQVAFEYTADEELNYIGFNVEFLSDCILAMSKLGHKDLEIAFSAPNRAALIYPIGQYNKIISLKTDFCLVMPVILYGDYRDENRLEYNFESNCSKFKNNDKLFCFDSDIKKTNEIQNLKNKITEIESKKAEEEIKPIIEVENIEPKKEISPEQKEWKDAISTFNELISIGGSESELKEWNEAIDTFKMLLGDDAEKFAKGGEIEDEQNKLKLQILKLTSKSFKMMPHSPVQKRIISEIDILREKLKNLGGKFENGGDIGNKSHEELERMQMESQFGKLN